MAEATKSTVIEWHDQFIGRMKKIAGKEAAMIETTETVLNTVESLMYGTGRIIRDKFLKPARYPIGAAMFVDQAINPIKNYKDRAEAAKSQKKYDDEVLTPDATALENLGVVPLDVIHEAGPNINQAEWAIAKQILLDNLNNDPLAVNTVLRKLAGIFFQIQKSKKPFKDLIKELKEKASPKYVKLIARLEEKKLLNTLEVALGLVLAEKSNKQKLNILRQQRQAIAAIAVLNNQQVDPSVDQMLTYADGADFPDRSLFCDVCLPDPDNLQGQYGGYAQQNMSPEQFIREIAALHNANVIVGDVAAWIDMQADHYAQIAQQGGRYNQDPLQGIIIALSRSPYRRQALVLGAQAVIIVAANPQQFQQQQQPFQNPPFLGNQPPQQAINQPPAQPVPQQPLINNLPPIAAAQAAAAQVYNNPNQQNIQQLQQAVNRAQPNLAPQQQQTIQNNAQQINQANQQRQPLQPAQVQQIRQAAATIHNILNQPNALPVHLDQINQNEILAAMNANEVVELNQGNNINDVMNLLNQEVQLIANIDPEFRDLEQIILAEQQTSGDQFIVELFAFVQGSRQGRPNSLNLASAEETAMLLLRSTNLTQALADFQNEILNNPNIGLIELRELVSFIRRRIGDLTNDPTLQIP